MNASVVRSHFDEEATQYDNSIRRLVPHYQEQHELILQILPFDKQSALRILDLGCGTGVLSRVLLGSFPNASVVSLDLSPNMVETCKRNLAAYSTRVDARRANFGEDDIGSGYDLVVSGFAIHHLTDAGKQELYNKIFRALRPGGMFINRELVLGATPALTKLYENCWREFVRANGEGGEEWFKKYVDEDIPASVEDQTAWLKQAGFTDVGCHWRYLGFSIFGGRKP